MYGNDSVLNLAKTHPREFLFFANEVPDLPEARAELEKYLKLGARGIGEQKFGVECDSVHIRAGRRSRAGSRACPCCCISGTAITTRFLAVPQSWRNSPV